MLIAYPSIHNGELAFSADHAGICFGIGHPDGRMFTSSSLSALLEQITDAFVNMCHPFLFFGCCGSVNRKALSTSTYQPTVAVQPIIFKRLKFDIFQRNNMLLVVFLLVQDDIAVDEKIVEEEKLSGFGLFPTSFG